jgi:hypothetical protein
MRGPNAGGGIEHARIQGTNRTKPQDEDRPLASSWGSSEVGGEGSWYI